MNYAQIHSFAKQWLYEEGYGIRIGNQNYFKYPGTLYDIQPLQPRIVVGNNNSEKTIIKKTTDLNYIRKMGLGIIPVQIDQKFFHGQKVSYKLIKNEGIGTLERIPDNHNIEHDIINKRIRLTGRNAGPWGIGPWYNLKRDPTTTNLERIQNIKNPHDRITELRKLYLPKKEEDELQTVNILPTDMPIMITEENELLCIPESDDEPVCGMIGMRGSGKSYTLNSLAGRFFWYMKKRVGILNDKLAETGPWCKPWGTYLAGEKSLKFIQQLAKINEHPLPLPTVYLHPNTNNLRRLIHEREVGFKISWAFKDLIENYQTYFKHKEEWKLEKSGRYFRSLKESLLTCKNIEDIRTVIDEGVPEDQKLVKERIMSVMEDIFNQQILDIQNRIPSKWLIKDLKTKEEKRYNPFVTCLLTGLVPVLVTNNFLSKDYFPEYFTYITRDILEKQTQDEYFVKNKTRLMLMCDEITMLTSKSHKTVATEILEELAAEGRPQRVGFTWVTQNPEKISDRITSNTNYQFIFRFNKAEQANAIVKGFDLPKERKSEILNLKKFEMLACTTEKFALYDLETGERKILEGEARKGYVLPPLNQHKAPGTI